jgi:outer membrane scaffolding protein for murein synthesis (MipA/OmpV family)
MQCRKTRARGLALVFAVSACALQTGKAEAQIFSGLNSLISGNWTATVGGTVLLAPRYRGASGNLAFFAQPIISISKSGRAAPFVSRNDGISFALIDSGMFRVGPVGRLVFRRDDDDRDLRGLGQTKWGGELGAFVDFYATSWLRVRTELRHGIRAHHGIVADVSADAFWDYSPALRFSAGPRISWASADAIRPYFGVNAAQSAASGLAPYAPGSGIQSYGFGGAITWKVTDRFTTSFFAEYSRLTGPVADSSLVRQRGSIDQFTVGMSATYRFNFGL